jgi:hypothetical protein
MRAKETAEHHAYNITQYSTLLNTAKGTVEHCTYIQHNIAQTHNTVQTVEINVLFDLRIKKLPMKEAVKE